VDPDAGQLSAVDFGETGLWTGTDVDPGIRLFALEDCTLHGWHGEMDSAWSTFFHVLGLLIR